MRDSDDIRQDPGRITFEMLRELARRRCGEYVLIARPGRFSLDGGIEGLLRAFPGAAELEHHARARGHEGLTAAAIEEIRAVVVARSGLRPDEVGRLLAADVARALAAGDEGPRDLADLARIVRRTRPRQRCVIAILECLHERGFATFEELRDRVHGAKVEDSTIVRNLKRARKWIVKYLLPFRIHQSGTTATLEVLAQ